MNQESVKTIAPLEEHVLFLQKEIAYLNQCLIALDSQLTLVMRDPGPPADDKAADDAKTASIPAAESPIERILSEVSLDARAAVVKVLSISSRLRTS